MQEILNQYLDIQKKIFDYFGYVEDWTVIPLQIKTDKYWMICGPESNPSTSVFWDPVPFSVESIENAVDLYRGTIYNQRFLSKWVYRGKDYTMVSVDTHSDDNRFLMIFKNDMECVDEKLKKLAKNIYG